MSLTLLHTSPVHCATFETLRGACAPGLPMTQDVREDWLARAQDGISEALAQEIRTRIAAAPGPVLCTCTTLGPVAEVAGAVRIDWPMMQRAAGLSGPVLMVYCLTSTRKSSRDLLIRALKDAGRSRDEIRLLALPRHWDLFTMGQLPAFAAALARDIRAELAKQGTIGSVVLAQASMAGAAEQLDDLAIPVLSSPKLAFAAMMTQF